MKHNFNKSKLFTMFKRDKPRFFLLNTHNLNSKIKLAAYAIVFFIVSACSDSKNESKENKSVSNDTLKKSESVEIGNAVQINDTLNSIAQIIAGNSDKATIFKSVTDNHGYKAFSINFTKRWNNFDSTRIEKLIHFREQELVKQVGSEKTLFYPFSGPDILYPSLFFPKAERYIMIGLEPVGTLPSFNLTKDDSLEKYYNKLNVSLNSILNFSFFRTISMSSDLKNTEVDGTIHLLMLFLNKTGNSIVSAKPITVDTTGNITYLPSFEKLKTEKLKTKGVEIQFKTPENKLKELHYFSLNASDEGIKNNVGFKKHLSTLKSFNTYLKGASYLLHKSNFSIIRNCILNGSSSVIQDDSGIALKYFEKNNGNWDYKLYGNYSRPISLFNNCYQKDLDSLYKKLGSTPVGFGIGYNFKDKNSNLMVINRK